LLNKKFTIMSTNAHVRSGLSFAAPGKGKPREIYFHYCPRMCPRMCSKQQNVSKSSSPNALNEGHSSGKIGPHRKQVHTGDTYVQNPKKAPAATRTPTMLAPMPVTLRAALLPPLKEPEGEVLGEVLEDVLVPVEGVEVVMEEGPPEVEIEEPVPEVELEDEEVPEMGSSMLNALVWESVLVTSPTGEAWKVYPEPAGTTGITTVTFPSEVATVFLKAKVLRKMELVR